MQCEATKWGLAAEANTDIEVEGTDFALPSKFGDDEPAEQAQLGGGLLGPNAHAAEQQQNEKIYIEQREPA